MSMYSVRYAFKSKNFCSRTTFPLGAVSPLLRMHGLDTSSKPVAAKGSFLCCDCRSSSPKLKEAEFLLCSRWRNSYQP